MPAPESYFRHLKLRLAKEEDKDIQDQLLDLWLEASLLATEWDAEKWGFDPENWMSRQRYQMNVRAARQKSINREQ